MSTGKKVFLVIIVSIIFICSFVLLLLTKQKQENENVIVDPFFTIREGMTIDEVHNILGKPDMLLNAIMADVYFGKGQITYILQDDMVVVSKVQTSLELEKELDIKVEESNQSVSEDMKQDVSGDSII